MGVHNNVNEHKRPLLHTNGLKLQARIKISEQKQPSAYAVCAHKGHWSEISPKYLSSNGLHSFLNSFVIRSLLPPLSDSVCVCGSRSGKDPLFSSFPATHILNPPSSLLCFCFSAFAFCFSGSVSSGEMLAVPNSCC